MYGEGILCASNAYEKKFYLNPEFTRLPEDIKNELKIMCVLYSEDVGGIFTISFDDKGELFLNTEAAEEDLLYDEIGAGLKIKQIRRDKAELLYQLSMFVKIFILGQDVE